MPIYEYQCEQCQAYLETFQSIKASPLVDCPQCQKPTLKRLVSAAGFRLKGGGWYETDFKQGQQKNIVQSEAKDTTVTESSVPASNIATE